MNQTEPERTNENFIRKTLVLTKEGSTQLEKGAQKARMSQGEFLEVLMSLTCTPEGGIMTPHEALRRQQETPREKLAKR